MDRTLTCAALSQLIADQAGVALLDVRRRPAFDAEPRLIQGAIWRNPEEVAIWASELNRDQPAIVYCVHGHEVSKAVADRLRELGFAAVLLGGGIEAWKAAGGSVTASSGGTVS